VKLVIFGLSISSSWGNGHATLWRGLCRALERRGHRTVFFERDTPYYAAHRDSTEIPGVELLLYQQWEEVLPEARRRLADADVAMVTSYCPDGVAASDLALSSRARMRVFYDLDTPVTLEQLRNGKSVPYISPFGLGDFDLALSYTGGATLAELKQRLSARRVASLYGSVDSAVHYPMPAVETYRADLSYLGTYAEDRQAALNTLFIEVARRLPKHRFVVGGSLYPNTFPWSENISFISHIPPAQHNAFYCSSTLTLNVTRGAMAAMGWCPSGRLFEAAACGAPIVSDWWEGLDHFFEPGEEILIARSTDDVIAAMESPREELARMARRARARALEEHSAERRAAELESILESASGGERRAAGSSGTSP
jgi:spore maturation protein CgeB